MNGVDQLPYIDDGTARRNPVFSTLGAEFQHAGERVDSPSGCC
jgi:hypothetical protein